MKQTFEEYLQEQHAKHYTGTDDDMPISFERFLENLDVQDLLDFGEIYGRTQFIAGKQFMLDEIKNLSK